MADAPDRVIGNRFALAALGFAAGLALWLLADQRSVLMQAPGLYLALFSFTGVLAAVALALAGPLHLRAALLGGAAVAAPVAGLMTLAGQRYARPEQALDQPDLLVLAVLIAFLTAPFALAALKPGRQWNSYETLFSAAWGLTVRYLAGVLFAAVFWLLAFLSDALLSLVQVGVIEWVLDTEWLVFAVSGAVLGLAVAVAYELRAALPPDIPLRLLRLLTVPVLAVVAVFLAAVPLRGLGEVFGALSSAGTLMPVALVMITLVSVALDRSDAAMPESPLVARAARALALLLPLVTGLAAWSVALRVLQYGWTPSRLLAACSSLFLLAYGITYAAAALRGRGWGARVRRANTVMALAAIGLAAALLSPLLDGGRIAAKSQLGRYAAGLTAAAELPLWEMSRDWGRAGAAALAQLEVRAAGGDAALAAQLEALAASGSRWVFERGQEPQRAAALKTALAAEMPVRPDGAALTPENLEGLPEFQLQDLLRACRSSLPDGTQGCVLVMGGFLPGKAQQGLVLYRASGGKFLEAGHLVLAGDAPASLRGAAVFDPGGRQQLPLAAIGQVLAGGYGIGAASVRALTVGGKEVLPWP